MDSWPVPPPEGYTVDDLLTLKDLPSRTELIDGSLVFASPQNNFHSVVRCLLEQGLRRSLPAHLRVRRGMAVVLDARNGARPDLLVVRAEAVTGRRQTRYDVADVELAVEVVSPDSESRDRDTKPHKYARAGIPNFWLVEVAGAEDTPVAHTYVLDPVKKVYESTGTHLKQLSVDLPYAIDVDLTEIDRL
ncbi:Uma2 family endonuclease [Streptomyces sp. NPDC054796]